VITAHPAEPVNEVTNDRLASQGARYSEASDISDFPMFTPCSKTSCDIRASSEGTILLSVSHPLVDTGIAHYASNRLSRIRSLTPPSLLNESIAIFPGDRQPTVSLFSSRSSEPAGSVFAGIGEEGLLGAGLARTVDFAARESGREVGDTQRDVNS
jgi:hypothetical protein